MPSFSVGELVQGGGDVVDKIVLDIDEKEIVKLKIGQTVEVKLCGVVGKLEVPPEGVSEYEKPRLGLRIHSRDIRVTGSDQMEGIRSMSSDDEYEDEALEEMKS